jgi:hypothetical protein
MIRTHLPFLLAAAALCGCAAQPRRESAFVLEGDAQVFLPGVVSSQYSEIRAATSPDGATVLWGSTNRPGGADHAPQRRPLERARTGRVRHVGERVRPGLRCGRAQRVLLLEPRRWIRR